MPQKEILAKTGQLKKVQGLYQIANRRKYAQFIVEGPQAVRELLTNAPNSIRDIYATNAALEAHQDIAKLITQIDPYLHLLPPALFTTLSTQAQGILAVAQKPKEVLPQKILAQSKLLLFALRACDPGNLGTIIRSADAFGAQAVITGYGSVEVTNPKVIRSSAGSVFHLPVLETQIPRNFIAAAKTAGFQILAADGKADFYLDELAAAKREAAINLERPTVWIFGNEAHGLTSAERELADATVAIRMQGKAESLNVAMASAICLYTSAQIQYCSSK